MTYQEFANEYMMLKIEQAKFLRNQKKLGKVLGKVAELEASNPDHLDTFKRLHPRKSAA